MDEERVRKMIPFRNRRKREGGGGVGFICV